LLKVHENFNNTQLKDNIIITLSAIITQKPLIPYYHTIKNAMPLIVQAITQAHNSKVSGAALEALRDISSTVLYEKSFKRT